MIILYMLPSILFFFGPSGFKDQQLHDFIQAFPHDHAVTTNHDLSKRSHLLSDVFLGLVEDDVHEMIISYHDSRNSSFSVKTDMEPSVHELFEIRAVSLFACHAWLWAFWGLGKLGFWINIIFDFEDFL